MHQIGGNISDCINYGSVMKTNTDVQYGGAGGIVGYTTNYTIERCTNYGQINGIGNIGGIGGCMNAGTIIKKCFNEGDVGAETNTNSNTAGGILGRHIGGTLEITNCSNKGGVIGYGTKGGIVGITLGSSWTKELSLLISNCCNIGEVNSKNNYAAGIIGMQGTVAAKVYVTLNNIYNAGEVIGARKGNIIGYLERNQEKTDTKTELYNVYCLDDLAAIGLGTVDTGETVVKTQSEMQSEEFVNILNNNIGENTEWKKWKCIINKYPSFE